MNDERLKNQMHFISLLLTNKPLVSMWVDGQPSIKYFDKSFHIILDAIRDANEHGVLLTRKSYQNYVLKLYKNKKTAIGEETLYNRISSFPINIDDFPMLQSKIIDSFLAQNAADLIQQFPKNQDKKGNLLAVKKLADDLAGLSDEQSHANKEIIYENVLDFIPDYIQKIKDYKSGKIKEDPILGCGIREIDDTMLNGFAPGTLTLFCGDVGGYKCGHYNNLQQLFDGSRKTLQEIYEGFLSGKQFDLMQYSHKDGKLSNGYVKSVFNSGIKLCFCIKTALGHEIISTAEHRHLSFGGYVKTSDLCKGGHIGVTRYSPFGNNIVSNEEAIALGVFIAEGNNSSNGCGFTNFDPVIVRCMKNACLKLGGRATCKVSNGYRLSGNYGTNRMKFLPRKYGIDGCLAVEKTIHSSIFLWKKEYISKLLSSMFGCDGRFAFEESKTRKLKDGSVKRKYKIMYCTSSYQLAKDVRDLLLKFGLIASIYEFETWCTNCENKEKSPSWRVELSDVKQIIKFIKEIGFLGSKQKLAESHLPCLENMDSNPNKDIIPSAIWDIVKSKFVNGKNMHGCRKFLAGKDKKRGQYPPIFARKDSGVSRDKLIRIAEYLDNDAELLSIANSDIYWDKIVSIEPIGYHQTYDLEMTGDHNFVSNNIITHNSTMMLNVALNIWKDKKENVLFVPLEMPREQVIDKMVSRETQINFEKIAKKKYLTDEEVQKIEDTNKTWVDLPSQIYFLEYMERIKVSTIKRQIEKHIDIFKPRLVVIDYIANLIPDLSRDGRNDLEIGDMLKDLRSMGRAYNFAIVSGAQIGREALKRLRRSQSDKMMAYSEDIRGSHEYSADADNIYAQFPDPTNPTERLQFFVIKARNGKKVFRDNQTSAVLEVKPEISLIRSLDWTLANTGDILKKVDDIIKDESFDKKPVEDKKKVKAKDVNSIFAF